MSFARSLFTVSSLTVFSRVGGFIRDTLTANFVGAGPIADAFFVAQRLPNLFRSLFAEGAFSAAFVPLYTAEQERNGLEAAQDFAGQALALLLAVLIPFSAALMLAMPWFMRVLAPGFEDNPSKYKLAVDFSTITFPYLALISVTALQSGVLNARGQFGPGAAAPIALNIVLILALFVAHYTEWHIGYTLSWALTFSGIVQMLWLWISCHRAKLSIPLVLPHLGQASRQLFKRIGPGAIGAGASQVNLLISTMLASSLPTGAVSFLFYADRLNQLPLGIIGIAVATTLLPLLSRHVASGDDEKVRHFTSRSIEFSLMLGLPATIGLTVASEPIIQSLFEHGQFSHANTLATASALRAYALGIPAFLLVKVFAAGFFARHDTSTPVKIAIIAVVSNIFISLLLLHTMQHTGIALSNSLALWINAILLFFQLRRRHFIGDRKLTRSIPRLLLAAVGMGITTWTLVNWTSPLFSSHNFSYQLLGLTLIIGVSGLGYGVMLQLFGAMRIQEIILILKRKTNDI